MSPVKQTIFSDKEKGVHGNCMQAAVASILELPLCDVPNFAEAKNFWGAVRRFFRQHNLQMMHLSVDSVVPGYYMVTGRSPRFADVLHQTIYHSGKLAHDPHPDNTGVTEITNVEILVPIDLGKIAKGRAA